MKKTLTVLAGFAAFFALALPAASRGGPEQTVFLDQPGNPDFSNPVDYLTWCGDCVGQGYSDGAPWVVNPGGTFPYTLPDGSPQRCLWDTDDSFEWATNYQGQIPAGATYTLQNCIYQGDGNANGGGSLLVPFAGHRWQGTWIVTSNPGLVVQTTWEWETPLGTRSVSDSILAAPYQGGVVQYRDCVGAPTPTDGVYQQIPSSYNLGSPVPLAVPILVTHTISNPTKHSSNKTTGWIDGGVRAAAGDTHTLCTSFRNLG